jgi:MOSC domain-containing protein YiiM
VSVVRWICVRVDEGKHEHPARVKITKEGGVEGDRWVRKPGRDARAAVTVMDARVAEKLGALGVSGDNLLVDLDLPLPPGTRLRAGSVVLEISDKPHTGCKKFSARFGLDALRWVTEQRARGVNCLVIEEGEVALGDDVTVTPPRSSDPSSPPGAP